MHRSSTLATILVGLSLSLAGASAQEIAKPQLLLNEIVSGMPKGEKQKIWVFSATIVPGGKTVFHTHPFPVTLYILSGTFTLEMEGHAPVILKAGQTMVEPPHVKMTGYNRSAIEPMTAIIFYVGDPDAQFLHLVP